MSCISELRNTFAVMRSTNTAIQLDVLSKSTHVDLHEVCINIMLHVNHYPFFFSVDSISFTFHQQEKVTGRLFASVTFMMSSGLNFISEY